MPCHAAHRAGQKSASSSRHLHTIPLPLAQYLPKDGFVDVPDKPGFGVTLSRANLHRPYPRSDAESLKQAAANKGRPMPTLAKMSML